MDSENNKPREDIRLTIERFDELVREGAVDTVVCAAPDPFGRLVGKRLTAPAFDALALKGPGVNVSSFVFGVDMEMQPLDLMVSNAENGYADVRLVPDLSTLRRIPWEPNAVVVLCDAFEPTRDELVAVAPRSILRKQIDRAGERGVTFQFASELEFFVADSSPKEAWAAGYRDLRMLSDYRADYQLGQAGRDEWFIHRLRTSMPEFGIPVESSKPEWGLGQHEITLEHASPLEMADRHVLFKYGVRELGHRANLTPTFMAKPHADEVGSSCHVHLSVWDRHGVPCGWSAEADTMSTMFGSFLAGLTTSAVELGVMYAPTINSYKRYRPHRFAGTAVALGDDNRSCAFRLVGRGDSYRVENRIPGADVNPYHAFSAMIAAGLHGLDKALPAPPIKRGNAWDDSSLETVSTSLRDSVEKFSGSRLARTALGDDVVEHLVGIARAEVAAFELDAVTDWERARYFDRA